MKVSEFDFHLPEELIAQTPLPQRDASRLLVTERFGTELQDRQFRDIVEYLDADDVLVINQTRVIPARLFGVRADTGGPVEILLLRPYGGARWEVLVKPGKRARVGIWIEFGPKLACTVMDVTEIGSRLVDFEFNGNFNEILEELGETPLPPYIHEKLDDGERYQTVYSKEAGSVAAPTAGLHFTSELLNEIEERGTQIVPLTLHVGLGTFRPVQVEDIEEHRMHAEFFELSAESAEAINACKRRGGRVWAVGTTTVRTLETQARQQGSEYVVVPGSGWTDIFIYPGYEFKIVDALITNFHLPKSSLLMLVSAFAGLDTIKRAYAHAVENRYRFFSFGDAMLLL
ncbi:MAG: tRNA preQ1(34) S-adenosylmethionine ribosyltransferase-isomerase QueA [Firmicutes bacterium]|nr:tRNA preQ1(34) S-adenosylmethionine ribosyltransferase-isomerase QueA [Bacillota bacterium]